MVIKTLNQDHRHNFRHVALPLIHHYPGALQQDRKNQQQGRAKTTMESPLDMKICRYAKTWERWNAGR